MSQWLPGGCLWSFDGIQQRPSKYVISVDNVEVTCYLCTAEQSARDNKYWMEVEKKRVFAIAIAHEYSKESETSTGCQHKVYVPVFCDGKKDSRLENMAKLWRLCKIAGNRGEIVLLQCRSQGMVRSPILLAALLIWGGYPKDEALGFISCGRCIYAGHFIRDSVCYRQQNQWLLRQLSEAHDWLSSLASAMNHKNIGGVSYQYQTAATGEEVVGRIGNRSAYKRVSKQTLEHNPVERDPPGTPSNSLVLVPTTTTNSTLANKKSSEPRAKRSVSPVHQDPPINKSTRLATSHTDNSTPDIIGRTSGSFPIQQVGVKSSLFDCSMDGLQTAGGQLQGFLSDKENLSVITLSPLKNPSGIYSQTSVPESLLNRTVQPDEILPHMDSWSLLNTDNSKALYSLFSWTDERVLWLASTEDGLILRSVLRFPPDVGTTFTCDIVER